MSLKKEKKYSNLPIITIFWLFIFLISPAQAEKEYVTDPEVTAIIASNPAIIHEQLIKSMKKILIDPATLTIKIHEYNLERSARGEFEKIEVFTSRGSVDGLILDNAEIEFEDVVLNTTKLLKEDIIDPVEMKNINMEIALKETDMNTFLDKKSKSIKVQNPNVNMKPGKIELSGSTRYGLVKVRFWATGVFRIEKSKEIWFNARRMKINHMAMPRSFIGMIVKKINPVFDLKKFPFNLNLSEIRIDEHKMIFSSYRKGDKKTK